MLVRICRKRSPFTLLGRMQICVVTVKNSIEALKKTRNKTTIWPRNSTTGHISKENKNTKLRMYHAPKCSHYYLQVAKRWKQSVSMNRRIDKEDVMYTHTMEYYSAIKRMTFCHLQQYVEMWRALCLVKYVRHKTNTLCCHSPVDSKTWIKWT